MPRTIKTYTGLKFFEDTPFWLMDQPAGPDDIIVGSADISATYDLKVYDVSQGGRPTLVHTETTGNLTLKASTTLGGTGGDPVWTLGVPGWTAALNVNPGSWDIPNKSGSKYRIVLLYNSTLWGFIPLIWEVECVQIGAPGALAS